MEGVRSLRMGIPAGDANLLSYSGAHQFITLPEDATDINLSGQIWVGSSATADDKDYGYIWFNNGDGELQQVFSTVADSQQWQPFDLDLSNFKGQTIQLLVGVYNDGEGGQVVMYADQLSVKSCK